MRNNNRKKSTSYFNFFLYFFLFLVILTVALYFTNKTVKHYIDVYLNVVNDKVNPPYMKKYCKDKYGEKPYSGRTLNMGVPEDEISSEAEKWMCKLALSNIGIKGPATKETMRQFKCPTLESVNKLKTQAEENESWKIEYQFAQAKYNACKNMKIY